MTDDNDHMRVAKLPDREQTVAQFWAEADAIIARRKELKA